MLAFLGSMVWMRFAAEEVVAVTMAAGTIFDISSPILAATLLSWAGAAGELWSLGCLPVVMIPR